MRFLATVVLMMSLVAMTVGAAGADVTKPEPCLAWLVPAQGAGNPALSGSRVQAPFGKAVLADAHWAIPWRPPCA